MTYPGVFLEAKEFLAANGNGYGPCHQNIILYVNSLKNTMCYIFLKIVTWSHASLEEWIYLR